MSPTKSLERIHTPRWFTPQPFMRYRNENLITKKDIKTFVTGHNDLISEL